MSKTTKNKVKGLKGINQIDTRGLTVPILVVIGIGTVAGVVYLTRNKVIYSQKKKIENNALDAGTTSNYAKRLQIAMGGDFDGTDEKAIFEVFSEFKSKEEFEQTQKDYSKLTNGKLLSEDLAGELTAEHYAKLQEILSQKKSNFKSPETSVPDNSDLFANMFKKAIEFYGVKSASLSTTDVEAIFGLIETIPNKVIYEKTKEKYKEITGRDLWADLENEWDLSNPKYLDFFSFYNDWSSETYIEELRTKTIKKFGAL